MSKERYPPRPALRRFRIKSKPDDRPQNGSKEERIRPNGAKNRHLFSGDGGPTAGTVGYSKRHLGRSGHSLLRRISRADSRTAGHGPGYGTADAPKAKEGMNCV